MNRELEKQYISNMLYLENYNNSLYKNIINTDISHLEINPTQMGINIKIDNNMIYPQDINTAIDNQVKTFLSNPIAISNYLPSYNKKMKGNELHSKLLENIEKISSYDSTNRVDYNKNKNLDTIPILIVSGVGNGLHIEKLIKSKKVKNIIIHDKDYSFLKLSMHIIDWKNIFDYFNQPSYSIDIFISNNAKHIAYSTINSITSNFPYKAYYIPYYSHYNSTFFNDINKHFIDKSQLMFQGLGFIDDELNSLRKTLKNLDHNIPVYMGTNDIPKNSTLFIVASGPSLDNDIEYIKKHKDDVVIFSCGTALRILEKNGITPDFHFEIEREEEIHDVLQQYTSKHIRDKVALVGLNVLYDKVFTEDFKESYLYFRGSDSGASIIPNNIPKLFHTNPTVTNGAISFATEFNWDKIYLFGADMGFKDINKHHSKDAFMYSPKNKTFDWHANIGTDVTNHLEANFGGDKVYCTSVFFWTKQRIENLLIEKNITIFNCSDGVKIERTIPSHAKDIVIEKIKKKKAIKAIKKNFEDLKTNKHKFKENYNKQVDVFYSTIGQLKVQLSTKQINSYFDIFYTIDSTFALIQEKNISNKNKEYNYSHLYTNLLRGTLSAAFDTIYSHSMATYDLQKAITFAQNSFNFISNYLEDIKKEVVYLK